MPRPHSTTTTERVHVDVEVVELGGRAQAVGVDVHERRAADERRMRARDHERRALHRAAHAEALPRCRG